MITNYFDENVRLVVTTPGNLAPISTQRWVYGDNYNLAVYVLNAGIVQPISIGDTLTAILFQTTATLPAQNLAIISPPVVQTDTTNNQFFSLNVNLKTQPVAALVQQGTSTTAAALFRLIFSPADGERFSASQDIPVTLISDPTVGASGATPIPPGYPTDPSVFERIANRGIASGYATLDSTGHVPIAQIPPSTAAGDMLKSVYDTNNNGIVDTCDTLQVSRVTGLGSAATQNVPPTGNASALQVVMGNDTRLTDTRTPIPHEATHLTGGSDSIPVASASGQGLCPQLDGVTVQINANGKLVATTTGSGDMLKSVFATNNPLNTTGVVDNALSVQTHQIPATGNASGAQLVIATDTRLSDARTPIAHEATHMPAGSDAIPLATSSTPGLCPQVDNVTIQISASKLAAILATSVAPGIVRPDNSSITISGGVLSAVGLGPHGCRLHNSINISLATTVTILTFDTNEFDTDSYHSTTTNQSRITIPSAQAGYYVVGAWVYFTGSAAGSFRAVRIKKNGATNGYICSQIINNNLNQAECACMTIAKFVAGDYIECEATQDTGTTINALFAYAFTPSFYAFRIG